MASTSNKIVLAVVVDTSKASKGLDDLGRKVDRSFTPKIDGAGKAATRAGKSIGKIGTNAVSASKSMQGAERSISGVNAALQLIGVRGAPALQTLAGSASSLALSGFGPMALALAGGVGLITLISSLGSEASTAASELDKITASLETLSSKLDTTFRRLHLARLGLGSSASDASRELRIEALKRERAVERRVFGSIEGSNPLDLLKLPNPRDGTTSADKSGDAARRQRHAERINQINFEIMALEADKTLQEELAKIEKDRAAAAKSLAQSSKLKGAGLSRIAAAAFASRLGATDRPRSVSDSVDFFGSGADFFGEAGQNAAVDSARRGAGLLRPDEARRAQEFADLRREERERLERERLEFESLSGGPAPEKLKSQDQIDLERDSQFRARSLSRSISTELSDALQTQDWAGAAQAMAAAFSTAITDALAAGFVKSIGIEKTAAGVFESIGGAFSSGEATTT